MNHTSAARWVVVTGAAGGMGMAIVERCVRDGASVLATDNDAAGLADIAARFARVHALAVDARVPDFGDRVAACLAATRDGAPLVGVVVTAGVSVGSGIERITDDDWSASMEVNVTAPMRLSRALVPVLRASGGGSIVHIASPVALIGARKVSYSASKAALLGLTVSMARDLGRYGIRVNALLPGPTFTKLTADWSADRRADVARQSFLGRLCRVEDVAGAVAFLLGEDAANVTGSVLDVTGGSMIGAHG